MSPRAYPEHKSVSSRRTVDNTADLNGWKRIGGFGSYVIYESGDMRRLVDPNTGRVIAQYRRNQAGEVVIDGRL